jgi:hypothetical protein
LPRSLLGRFAARNVTPGFTAGPFLLILRHPGRQRLGNLGDFARMSAFARNHVGQKVSTHFFDALSNIANAKTPYPLRSPLEHTAYLPLIAKPIDARADALEWNAILQGTGESVFIDV